jgi:hypothetical protein
VDNTLRKQRNAESKAKAENDNQPWGSEELEWLQTWDGSEAYLAELGELLGRTIEGCRERFYKSKKNGWCVSTTTRTTPTTTTYRGWTCADGDGW